MQSELKPCPFCGSDRLMVLPPTCDRDAPYSAADRAYPVVRCSGCYTDVPGKDFDASSKSAVEAWNRRSALSDKQAGEVKAQDIIDRSHTIVDDVLDMALYLRDCPRENIWKYQDAANRLAAFMNEVRSALVDVPAVEPVGYTTQWNLDEVRAGRLGTIAPADTMRPENEIPLYTSPPLSREGEDSAKVERLRDALEKISDGYGPNHLSAFCRNIAAEALAATRSGSATDHSGGDRG